jgi:hypothetical protein
MMLSSLPKQAQKKNKKTKNKKKSNQTRRRCRCGGRSFLDMQFSRLCITLLQVFKVNTFSNSIVYPHRQSWEVVQKQAWSVVLQITSYLTNSDWGNKKGERKQLTVKTPSSGFSAYYFITIQNHHQIVNKKGRIENCPTFKLGKSTAGPPLV